MMMNQGKKPDGKQEPAISMIQNLCYLDGQKGGLNPLMAPQIPMQQLQQMQMMGINPNMISGFPMMGMGNNGMQAVMLPMQAPQLGDKNQPNLPMGMQMMGLPQGFPQGLGFQNPQNFLG